MALIEEKIVLREDGQQWKYSLSNNLDEIRDAIYKRVGITDPAIYIQTFAA
jgi:hypothetical protein